uniref:Uncharacterized protein n=1 Tax=Arundo donax TaxID=35708 RepID=A0A0A9FED3_ARUDO
MAAVRAAARAARWQGTRRRSCEDGRDGAWRARLGGAPALDW